MHWIVDLQTCLYDSPYVSKDEKIFLTRSRGRTGDKQAQNEDLSMQGPSNFDVHTLTPLFLPCFRYDHQYRLIVRVWWDQKRTFVMAEWEYFREGNWFCLYGVRDFAIWWVLYGTDNNKWNWKILKAYKYFLHASFAKIVVLWVTMQAWVVMTLKGETKACSVY